MLRAAGGDSDEEGGGPPPSFPGFGTSESDTASVNTFYANWATFTTCRSFAWADQYNPAGAPSRYAAWGMHLGYPQPGVGCVSLGWSSPSDATPGMPCGSLGYA